MKTFLVRRWFLIVLAVVLAVGICFAEHLAWLVQLKAVRDGIVFVVLFVMAFPLKAGAFWGAVKRPGAPLLASGINYLALPLVAWAVSPLLLAVGMSRVMVLGVLVAAATPSTLASASVWTRRAGGNDAISMVVTILTNAACFVITPLWLLAMTGEQAQGNEFDPLAMIVKLGVLVVLPMALAQAARLIGSVGTWATEHKTPLGVLAQCGVLSMVFLGAVNTGLKIARAEGQSAVLLDIFAAIAVVMALHVGALLLGVRLARLLRLNRADAIAVGFAGSQKTLMVGLTVSLELGYSAIPIVVYHVGQLLIDTLVADRYRQRTEQLERSAAPAETAAQRALAKE